MLSRRSFLSLSGIAGGGLLLGAPIARALSLEPASDPVAAAAKAACDSRQAHLAIEQEIAQLLSRPALDAEARRQLRDRASCPLCGSRLGPAC